MYLYLDKAKLINQIKNSFHNELCLNQTIKILTHNEDEGSKQKFCKIDNLKILKEKPIVHIRNLSLINPISSKIKATSKNIFISTKNSRSTSLTFQENVGELKENKNPINEVIDSGKSISRLSRDVAFDYGEADLKSQIEKISKAGMIFRSSTLNSYKKE